MDAIQEYAKSLFASNPILALMIAFAPTGIPALFVLYQRYREDRNKRKDGSLTREQQRQVELDNQQKMLTEYQVSFFQTLRQENQALLAQAAVYRAELVETRKDRDDGWEYAQGWYKKSHAIQRNYRELRHDYIQIIQWTQSVNHLHPEIGLPETVGPIPDRPSLPLRIEDIGNNNNE